MAHDKATRFWRWYRTIPILAMALVAALSLGLAGLPSEQFGRFRLPINYKSEILDSSGRHGVDPLLVCAVIKCESNWDPDAVSGAGAVGLMQIMPATSAELASYGLVDRWSYDPDNLTDPQTNIEYGCAYLAQLTGQLGSTDEVIAAYNAGPGSVTFWLSGGGDIADAIAYPETALYLKSVQDTYAGYQRLYTETLNER
ncbi:MAG: lytic transglycosylase domain-containing protein [Acidobacteriota bacterium]|nr:lytic transglycosylase domain-containing protein [Acidobacteriota bacterium]